MDSYIASRRLLKNAVFSERELIKSLSLSPVTVSIGLMRVSKVLVFIVAVVPLFKLFFYVFVVNKIVYGTAENLGKPHQHIHTGSL